ncbi:MAG: hypothetical protein WCG80_08370 [Spirochaetales bacterium]
MKKTLLVLLLLGAGMYLSAQENPFGFGVASLDVAVSDDVPIGDYAALSADNLGGSVRVNFAVDQVPFLMPYLQLDNTWWLGSPSFVSWGTQINALMGMSAYYPLPLEGLGTLRLGGGIGYGLMLHLASADTTGSGAALKVFVDQALAATLEFRLDLNNTPFSVLLTPRYLFSPEASGQVHQAGVQLGVAYSLNQKN